MILTSLEIAQVSDAISQQFQQRKLPQFSENSGHDNISTNFTGAHMSRFTIMNKVPWSLHSGFAFTRFLYGERLCVGKQPALVLLWFCSWFRGNFNFCDWPEKMQSSRMIGRGLGMESSDWSAQMSASCDWTSTNCAAFNCAATSALISLAETVEVLKKQRLLMTSKLFWTLNFPSKFICLSFSAYFVVCLCLNLWCPIVGAYSTDNSDMVILQVCPFTNLDNFVLGLLRQCLVQNKHCQH